MKQILSIFLTGALFIPMLQQITGRLTIRPLHGDIVIVERPALNWNNWIKGSYQQQADEYLKANYGCQPFFIRLNNQIQYSLFNKIKAKNVIEGKEGYLYEENYIKAYFGTDFIGDDSVSIRINNLIRLRDTLQKSGTELLIILAPGKGSFFPEYFPDNWKNVKKDRTNHEAYKTQLSKSNLHFIDMKTWIDGMKDTSRYPLFPKCGIHWSKYGEYLAADSLIKYINHNHLAKVGGMRLDKIEISEKNKDGDYDIGEGMNLLCDLNTYPMAYPKYDFDTISKEKNDRILMISDSYYWELFNKGMSDKSFGRGQFWFYNIQIYPDSYDHQLLTTDLDNYVTELSRNKLVILMSTDANLYRFPFNVDSYTFGK